MNKEPRLRFTDEERSDPALEKPIRKAEKAAARADKAQANIPKKKVRQTVIDPDTGKKTSKLTFEDKKKPPSKVSQGVREAPVHLVAGKLHKEIRETEQDNVGVESAHKSEEAVETGAYLVREGYCDEFIQRLPDGYQTVLGENGSTLSGGERQRISIARALLKDAPIILLDEATASLDPENEVLIQRAIAKLVEGKTVIMIAHRLRTVVDADQILVLDNGRLVEHGTHDELMKKNGLYHKLFHIQQESLGWAV